MLAAIGQNTSQVKQNFDGVTNMLGNYDEQIMGVIM